MNRTIVILTLIIFMFVALNAENITNELSSKYHQKIEFKRDTYQQIKQFIKDNPESPSKSDLYYKLADLSIEVNVQHPEITLGYFESVLQYDSSFSEKDAVLYNIGYFNYLVQKNERDEGRIEHIDLAQNWPDSLRLSEESLAKSIEAFTLVETQYKDSPYWAESIFRLGNLYLEIALDSREREKYYLEALSYYEEVIKSDNLKLKDHALFQKGWTNFYSGNFENAISDFDRILRIIDEEESENLELYFEADAIENMAFSLIEFDNYDYNIASEASQRALQLFRNYFNHEYAREIIYKAIELELLYAAPMRAVDLYNTLLTLYPNYIHAPSHIDSIMTIYGRYPNRIRGEITAKNAILEENERIINAFNSDSDWYKSNDEIKDNYIFGVIRDAYDVVEPRWYNNFVNDKTELNYIKYSSLLDQYSSYPQFKDIKGYEMMKNMQRNKIKISQSLADTSDNPSYYLQAIHNMKAYLDLYPADENTLDYKEDIFYSYEMIYYALEDSLETAAFDDSVHNVKIDKPQLKEMYISASKDFEETLRDTIYIIPNRENRLIALINYRAELEFEDKSYDRSYNDFNELLNFELDNIQKIQVYSKLAEISNSRNNFLMEETYYRMAAEIAENPEKETLTNNYLAAIQSHAQELYSQSDFDSAAVEYLRLSDNVSELGISSGINYKLKAIDSYESGKLYQDAINQYMEIAETQTEKNDVFAVCRGAWTISDSVLVDWIQSEYLRQYFINRFPASNEAYKLRLQVIGFYESEIFSDTLAAGHMYLDLHDNIVNMNIAQDDPAKIYLKAIKIFRDHDLHELANTHMLRFEKIYPQHPMSIEFLKTVALYYSETGDEEEFEKLAREIYRKHPEVDLLTDIAILKFRDLKTKIDSSFTSQDYQLMNAEIENFSQVEQDYLNEGLTLPLESIYEQFNYYQNYQKYYERYDNELAAIESDFLVKLPDELIRVNEFTEWKKHIINNRRVNKVMDQCEEIRSNVVSLIKDGIQFDITTNKKTKALYQTALCYEHGAEVAKIQIKKFVDVSAQLNNETLAANPIKQNQYKENILAQGDKLAFAFTKKALEIHNYILNTFVEEEYYSDKWTDLSYQKLVDKGLKSPKIIEIISLDTLWTVNDSALVGDNIIKKDSLSWAMISKQNPILQRRYLSVIKPDFVKLLVECNRPIQYIAYNNTPVSEERMLISESSGNYQYDVRIINSVKAGENLLEIGFSDIDSALIVSPEITLQYEKELYDYYSNTEEIVINSSKHWLSALGDLGENPKPDSSWLFAGKDNFSFFKNQMYGLENSEAVGLWFPLIDTTEAQVCYFAKSVKIDSAVTEANLKLIGQKEITVWLNGEKIIDRQQIVLDREMNKAGVTEIELSQLVKGDNLLVVKVIGDIIHKGLIAELKVRMKKMDSGDVIKLENEGVE